MRTGYPRPVLLALDTATPLVAVSLHDGERVVAELTSDQPLHHGEHLAPLIRQVLSAAGIAPGRLTGIVAGTGPGPYTGLRVGLVTARTMGLALGVDVHGVCTLDAIAAQAAGEVQSEFVVATDARRKEVYLAVYDADGRRLTGPVVDQPAAVADTRPTAGEGPLLYPGAFPHRIEPQRPSAGWLARCVVDSLAEVTTPEPLYLRRPDAASPGAPKRVS